MASDTTREIIESYYDAFNRGDREGMLALLVDDVVHEINEGGVERGKAAFTAFLREMDRAYEERVVDLVVFTTGDPGRASAEFHIEGRYIASQDGLPPATGQAYRVRVGAFFELADGQISRVTNYYNLRHWIELVTR